MAPTRQQHEIERTESPTDPAAGAGNQPADVSEPQRDGPTESAVFPEDGSRTRNVTDETVRLISSEGKYLDVPLRIAKECELIDRILSGGFAESRKRELNLPSIRYRTLCKVVEYLRRKCQWREGGATPLEFEVEDDIAIDLLIAADFLGMK